MKHLKHSSWVRIFTLATALATTSTYAQDTLSISGTFHMDEVQGTVGADLAAVFANDNEHWWRLTLYGVSHSNDFDYDEWTDELGYHYYDEYITRVHATSFDFEFMGPDAATLNQVVSQQLIRGSLSNEAFLELRNSYYYVSYDSGGYDEAWDSTWDLGLQPLDPAGAVSFFALDTFSSSFSSDLYGFPIVEPERLTAEHTEVIDNRTGNSGELLSFNDIVDIGSSGLPLPPTLSIADGFVLEGNSGTIRLDLRVTLSAKRDYATAVDYQTANGSASRQGLLREKRHSGLFAW